MLITCFKGVFPLWVVSQLFTKSALLESECLEERITILPTTETTEEEVTSGNGGENGLAVAEVHPGRGRAGGRAARNVMHDDARLLVDVAPPVLPTAAIGRSNDLQFTQSASE